MSQLLLKCLAFEFYLLKQVLAFAIHGLELFVNFIESLQFITRFLPGLISGFGFGRFIENLSVGRQLFLALVVPLQGDVVLVLGAFEVLL